MQSTSIEASLRSPLRRFIALAFVFLVLNGMLILYLSRLAPPDVAHPLETGFYVWQEVWTSEVEAAVDRSVNSANGYWVFAGHLEPEWRGGAQLHPPDWLRLAGLRKPVTLVFRIHHAMGRSLNKESFESSRSLILEPLAALAAQARISGVSVAGVQIDYDCPTSKLGGFREWLLLARPLFPNMELSITALPTWMSSQEFKPLVQSLDYYVLQVHSFQSPAEGKAIRPIFDAHAFPSYLRRAAKVGVPFYLSLPTYGYRIYLDREGRFQGLRAEGPQPVLKEGYTEKILMANAVTLSKTVKELNEKSPSVCRGLLWFRLPVEGDRLNWSWPAMQAVMQGRAPQVKFETELRWVNPELVELWVHNRGEFTTPGEISVTLSVMDDDVLAYDLMSDYRPAEDNNRIIGPAPRSGEPTLAAWYRIKKESSETAVKAGDIEVMP